MPEVTSQAKKRRVVDPNYPTIEIDLQHLTDHFYDTGVYKIEWEKAEFLKTNHPFMGKMSFPENEQRTSRTIMATRSASTREALLYESEYNRKGDGRYRLPTIREVASLMGFPYVYQFTGSEGAKWRQIGNSVCPHQSAALAKTLRQKLGLQPVADAEVDFSVLYRNYNKVNNLNTFKKKEFTQPRKRQVGAKFRRHAIKLGNMTVDLMNYHPNNQNDAVNDWHVAAFFGTGDGYTTEVLSYRDKKLVARILEASFGHWDDYKKKVSEISPVAPRNLQQAYEDDLKLEQDDNPISLLKSLAHIITAYDCHRQMVKTEGVLRKRTVPLAQLMSAYGLLAVLGGSYE